MAQFVLYINMLLFFVFLFLCFGLAMRRCSSGLTVFCQSLPSTYSSLHICFLSRVFCFINVFCSYRGYAQNKSDGDGSPPEATELSFSSKNFAVGFTRTSMSELLHMIKERKSTTKQTTSFPDSGPAVLAQLFTSVASTAELSKKQQMCRQRAVSKFTSVKKMGEDSPQETNICSVLKPAVSPTLLQKLRRNVICKRIDWGQMLCKQQTLQNLSLWRYRTEWGTRFLSSSAVDLSSADSVTDFFCCSAPTGSGKSSLVPLFLLDSHWTRLLQRIDVSSEANCEGHLFVDDIPPPLSPPEPFCTTGSACDFVANFGASSRLCIVVSQPTRLACVELAKFTSSLIALCSESPLTPSDVACVGGRVGYAVGGDTCFSSATEIIYATPGYIVNALQHKGGALSPTTLIIDEAHCRDIQTDLLLAWTKQQLQNKEGSRFKLRQLVLMSATLPVEQMVALVTSKSNLWTDENVEEKEIGSFQANAATPNKSVTFKPNILSVESAEPGTNKVSEPSLSGGAQIYQHRVERFFLDDLTDNLVNSHVLFGGIKPSSSTRSPLFPLLAPPARRVMTSLVHFFSYTRFPAEIHSPQARVLAQFLLYLVQTFAMNPIDSACSEEHTKRQWHTESVLVFLPGFSEMSVVLQWLESLSKIATARSVEQLSLQPNSTTKKCIDNSISGDVDLTINNNGVAFLQFENCLFSVALLHSTAIGSLQQQLRKTAGPFRYRIILSTTVAESSVTIPNVRCVVDSCLERSFFTDPLTGVMLRRTTLASASSLIQRGGRTGRTCDGIVIHLAPRRIFDFSKNTYNTSISNVCAPHVHAINQSFGRAALLSLMAPAQSPPESIKANAAAVLLSVKYLFPSCASTLVKNLPSPPSPRAISRAVVQLVELGLLQPQVECDNNNNVGVLKNKKSLREKEFLEEKFMDRQLSKIDIHAVLSYYNYAKLTAKGEFVAYFPVPHEQALLIYFALQFACVEEALLIACAMTVPSLLIVPRITAQGDSIDNGTPAVQFLLSLETQRKLAEGAGKRKKGGKEEIKVGKHANAASSFSLSERTKCHLSEPLMLLSLLREWYACSNNTEVVEFHKKYHVNRSSLRIVDSCVSQCAARLHHLITFNSKVDNDRNDDNITNLQSHSNELHGEYDTSVRRPSTWAIEELIVRAFPVEYRRLLASSLRRLHICAMEHAGFRFSDKMRTMTHWYPHEEQLVRVLQPLTVQKKEQKKHKGDSNENRYYSHGNVDMVKFIFGSVQQRLSAAFVAAFARNTMRGEDSAHRVHNKRLLRNKGALHEDVNNICSFNIELQTREQETSLTKDGALYNRLTAEELDRVLRPYLAGTCLRQLELFSNMKSAVACFGVMEHESEDEKDTFSQLKQQNEEVLLLPQVLPFEQVIKQTYPNVTLAHIGISLLVSMQSALTRLTILLPPSYASKTENVENIKNTDLSNLYVCSDNEYETCIANRKPNDKTKLSFTVADKVQSGIYFTPIAAEEIKDGISKEIQDMCVTWHDKYGIKRSLLLSDVRRAGYDELFPTPFSENSLLDASVLGKTTTSSVSYDKFGNDINNYTNKNSSNDCVLGAACVNISAPHSENKITEDDENVVLSIHRVVFTNALTWKVTLPAMQLQKEEVTHSFSEGDKIGSCESYYCWVCHSTWMQKAAFYAHCRSFTHLNRLAFAVQYRMRREWVSAFSCEKISTFFLRNNHNNAVNSDDSVELWHCGVSSTSFLNALQWHPRSVDAAATMPIAIAGSLILNATGITGATSPHRNGSALQALHVWVLDTCDVNLMTTNTDATLHATPVVPSSLFVLAGYLAATSSGFNAALLMNMDHSKAYAVMLHDWAVWQFPAPLTRTQLQSVFDVFAGKPWRGVPFYNTDDSNSNSTKCNNNNNNNNGNQNSRKTESLHWCVVSAVCPQCTYCGSGCCEENESTHSKQKLSSFDKKLSLEKAVESTILLVLHEYKNSRRNVVGFAEYIQRVVAKLSGLSAGKDLGQKQLDSSVSYLNTHGATKNSADICSAAELLARFVARRQQQPLELLLRDIGCQFLSQPAVSLQTTSKRSSSTVISVEGRSSIEKVFLLPSILPSYLPSPDFSAQLSRQRKDMRDVAAGVVKKTQLGSADATALKKLRKEQPQPLF